MSAPDIIKYVKSHLSDDQKEALTGLYGGPPGRDVALLSDILFTEQARALARMHRHNGYRTYLYRFTAIAASRAGAWRGAPHASERQYVFDRLSASPWPTGPRDEALARIMNADWSQFATVGEPRGSASAPWPVYDDHTVMDFMSDGAVAKPDPWERRLDALAAMIDARS